MNKIFKIFLGIFITFIVLILSSGFEISIKSNIDSMPAGVGSQIGILIISILLIYIFSKKRIIEFYFKKVKLQQLILPIGLTVILLIIRQLIHIVSGNEEHPAVVSMSIVQQLIFIVVLASLGEELLFRGFLQNMLNPVKSYGINLYKLRLSLPVIISGILFGTMHFALIGTGASLRFVIQIVIFGIFLGILAGYFQEKRNNFTYAFIVHITANLSGLILSMI
ncbi:MAG: CPBP family intramembrane metalloprotease [Ignavibacteria bacterium]|nr:CPBP family intramembrane metalloprotease [Ignavibacteria bacterium]